METLISIFGLLVVFLFPVIIYLINIHLEKKAEQRAADNKFKYKANPERFNYIECTKKSDLQSAKRKKTAVTFRNLAIAGVVVALIINSCDFDEDKDKNDNSVITATVEHSETQESQNPTERDVNESAEHTAEAITETTLPRSKIVQGDGYSFIKPEGWRLQLSQDGGDFEVHYSIPYANKGVIAVYVSHFPMDEFIYEEGDDLDDFANDLYDIYYYVYSEEENTTVSKNLERSRRISGEITYKFYMNTVSDIITYDPDKVEYGKDEYGNTVITNMDELELVEYHDIPCRSYYYWVQNGNDFIEVNIVYTLDEREKAEKYLEEFLNGIKLEKAETENENE